MTKLITIDYDKYIKLTNLKELQQKFETKVFEETQKEISKIRKQLFERYEELHKDYKESVVRNLRKYILANSVLGFISTRKLEKYIKELEKCEY